MLSIFEIDEFAQYPHLIRMLTLGSTYKESIYEFVAYQHYFYGYPFYLISALVLLPLKISGGLFTTPNIVFTLRFMISVLPMLLSIMIWIHLQVKTVKPWKPIVMFLFLAFIPAVFRNNLWWHPDSLTILFITLTFLFLDRDGLRFGKHFKFAAITCGLAVATKLLGLFFILTIPTYIIFGILKKTIRRSEALVQGLIYVVIMVLTFLLANPMLLLPQERAAAINIQQNQAAAMSFGWAVAYTKGPAAWYEMLKINYGVLPTLIFGVAALLAGIRWNEEKRMLNILILTWVVPFSFYLLFFIAIKPFHFFLPIILPLYSALPNLTLPWNLSAQESRKININHAGFKILSVLGILVILLQFGSNLQTDYLLYQESLNKEANSAAISFMDELDSNYLYLIPADRELIIFRETNVYVPIKSNWHAEFEWGLIDAADVSKIDYHLVLISRQHILDYTNENIQEIAQDPFQMAETFKFYTNAEKGELDNYQMIFENNFGIAFLRQDLFDQYLSNK